MKHHPFIWELHYLWNHVEGYRDIVKLYTSEPIVFKLMELPVADLGGSPLHKMSSKIWYFVKIFSLETQFAYFGRVPPVILETSQVRGLDPRLVTFIATKWFQKLFRDGTPVKHEGMYDNSWWVLL